MPFVLRRLPLIGMTTVLAVLAFAATSSAQAQTGTFFDRHTDVNSVGTPECVSGDFAGTETATFTTSGRFVATDSGFHFEGMETLVSHTDFTNGDFIVATARNHFTFNTTFTSGQTVSTFAANELHTLYDGDGGVVARVSFHNVSHITYRDLNGNGQPDEGEIRVSFERSFFTCA
jgi:hypothetical protein